MFLSMRNIHAVGEKTTVYFIYAEPNPKTPTFYCFL